MEKEIIVESAYNFRHLIALSFLTRKKIKINNLGMNTNSAGINDYEISLLELANKLSNGSKFQLSSNSTTLTFIPGLLIGGLVKHKCCISRSISYYLEFVSWILLILKSPLELILEGVTNNFEDTSVDLFKNSSVSLLKKFGFKNLELTITRRGCSPMGGGQIVFKCSPIDKTCNVDLSKIGKIKRIRGIAYSMRVSPKISQTLVEKSKGILLNYIPDIYITTDHMKGFQGGLSPGYGLQLHAETTTDLVFCAESTSPPKNSSNQIGPEQIAIDASHRLFQEIYQYSSVDTSCQSLLIIYMSLGPQYVSRAILPKPSQYIINLLRFIKQFLGVTFKISQNIQQPQMRLGASNFIFSCIGAGLVNINKSRS